MKRAVGLFTAGVVGVAYVAIFPRPWLWVVLGVTIAVLLLWPVRGRDAL